MGTELLLPGAGGGEPEQVWPPTAPETQFGYKRRAKLSDARVVPGQIIQKVLCFGFYGPLVDLAARLGFRAHDGARRLYSFPYDWRLDLFNTAERLSELLDRVRADGATRITLVGHSMGGLVCRLLLEDPRNRGRSWFGAIEQLIAIATPHLGAPLALGRVLGLDQAIGISGEDFAWLASLDAYPSAYQLLPAPGEIACWDQSNRALAAIDFYDRAVAGELGLKPSLLARAEALHAILGQGRPPPNVRYFAFGAAGHRTVTRINIFRDRAGRINRAATVMTRTPDCGDGTVPLYSAIAPGGQRQIVVNDHATAFKGVPFERVFARLLGGDLGDALETAVRAVPTPTLSISIESPVVPANADIEVLLNLDPGDGEAASAVGAIEGVLLLNHVRDDNAADSEAARFPVTYSGPAVGSVRLHLPPISTPGHYRLTFAGLPRTRTQAQFAVILHQTSPEEASSSYP